MDAWSVIHSLIGFFLLHAIAWSLSEDRETIALRPVIAGRRDEIVSLGGKTIVSGTLATCIAGSVVGILY
jgi:CNT family concentrative nucleoside transporter